MLVIRVALSVFCLGSLTLFGADSPVVKRVQAPATSPASGPEMFKQYCASCHGANAKGDGRVVSALKVPPPDLTLLAKKNHGKFPDTRVYSAIRGDLNVGAHGSSDMPVWGLVFRDMANKSDDNRQTAMRLSSLCRYIESLQQK